MSGGYVGVACPPQPCYPRPLNPWENARIASRG
jgi:hypothetical protein